MGYITSIWIYTCVTIVRPNLSSHRTGTTMAGELVTKVKRCCEDEDTLGKGKETGYNTDASENSVSGPDKPRRALESTRMSGRKKHYKKPGLVFNWLRKGWKPDCLRSSTISPSKNVGSLQKSPNNNNFLELPFSPIEEQRLEKDYETLEEMVERKEIMNRDLSILRRELCAYNTP